MLSNDACVGWSPLTSEVPKDRVMVISLMVGCQRTRAETGIVQTEKGSVQLVMLMINYASAERLRWRQRQSWICDTERNSWSEYLSNFNLIIRFQPGHLSTKPDALTCHPDLYLKEGRKTYGDVNPHNFKPIFSSEQISASL